MNYVSVDEGRERKICYVKYVPSANQARPG